VCYFTDFYGYKILILILVMNCILHSFKYRIIFKFVKITKGGWGEDFL